MTFKYDCDEVYFAYCYPYTYSDCGQYLARVCTYGNKDKIRRAPLCKTIAGNDVEMVIITDFGCTPEAIAERPAVVLTGRLHPGETASSFVMEGIINTLVGDTPVANELRKRFVFKIIPMLNPDGVIIGNYRSNLSGSDLNRQWVSPGGRIHPEVAAVKGMMRKTLESREIFFFCDFHAHSR